ncbi:probable 3-hydroxyisobutyryl-CoA hydrolase 3 isoform X3 [Musa acuminata AAA Group]|uniref:probable 3-hydroxyisobutyryl-CoA hydrolase 3 isoform X3 n=1 Tax=Musa acuminata AAA Group TaxID=214697 RepID=UPI0031D5A078
MASSSQNASNDGTTNQVLVEDCRFTRILTLNRPRQLNALSTPMIMKLLKLFVAYEKDSDVKLLIVKGNGRAFSAGGDVAAVVQSVTQGHWTLGAEFFRNEYTLNYIIATYSKPQVSILDGIVMGGGAGISIHGRFRVVTEKTVFAMPETALGFFPDIGASYFLSRLPGFFGEYVGLTGARLDGAEMLACGLATHFVPSMNLTYLEDLLTKVETSDPFVICAIIDQFSKMVPLKIREGRLQGVDRCLMKDFRLCCHILRFEASKDFSEGCRAILVDKDRNPKWEPSRLDLVDSKVLDQYFAEVDDPNWEDLKLPSRCSLDVKFVSKI